MSLLVLKQHFKPVLLLVLLLHGLPAMIVYRDLGRRNNQVDSQKA